MSENTKQVAFRLPVDLIKSIDCHIKRMKLENPGMGVTRSDAVRVLLTEGDFKISKDRRMIDEFRDLMQ